MSFLEKLKQKTQEISQKVLPELASDDVQKDRINICNSCEFLFTPTRNCKKCGCFVDAKTKLQSASCPINKW